MDTSMSSSKTFNISISTRDNQHSIQPPSHHVLTPTPSSKIPPQSKSQSPSQFRLRPQKLIPRTPLPTSSLLLLLFLTCCISITSAHVIYIPEQMVETPKDPSPAPAAQIVEEDLASALSRLARSGPILVDLSPPPKPFQTSQLPSQQKANAETGSDWTLATVADDLKKRQVGGNDDSDSSSTTSTSSARKTSPTSSSTETGEVTTTSAAEETTSSKLAPTKSSSSVVVAEPTSTSPLPTVFDNGFNGNITESCAAFMSSMLKNASFINCLPFSLLLQNSNSFFQASKSITTISRVLDASCTANSTTCSSLLSSFATNLTTASSCASDLTAENPLISQALLGLTAYQPLYTASCLRNPNTSSYCFADAITNKTSPTDSYIYYLPLNVSLPGGSQPTCNACLRDTMAVFGAASGERGAAIASTYVNAAMQVNVQCGPGFVNASLAAPTSFGVRSSAPTGMAGLVALAVVLGSWLL